MSDREFLIWIHQRLVKVHGESELVDYMHHLRAIIAGTPEEKQTVNTGQGKNGMEELRESLG